MPHPTPPKPIMQSPPGATTVIDGRRYVYFVGTGYLGLQGREEVIRAACEATEQYGIGSATSRTGYGNTPPVLDVERRAAEWLGLDDAFFFMSGYVGINILVQAAAGTFDAIFVDEASHYCVMEAARATGRPVWSFRHCDVDDLRTVLHKQLEPGERPLVLTDGVFAARGDVAPLAQYDRLLADYPGSALGVDDAHGVGVIGERGRGTFEYAGMFDARINTDQRPGDLPRLFLCGTMSKAVGGYGGIIPGRQVFIDRLKRTSPYYAGTSPPPVPVAAATAEALRLIAADPDLRARLHRNVDLLKRGLSRLGLPTDDTPVPIACLTIGDAKNMQRIRDELLRQGIVVAYMAAYSGLPAEGALRLAVFATHAEAMIERLLDALQKIL
ncbi:MAG TPA: pyridoxal phosphate-dependent aminotransferase family protein [Thermoguttaceae bacterium]|nr:pyridoxal phosphate-dependent aminotransferase family protein [Thermoguttaceae bacterium]